VSLKFVLVRVVRGKIQIKRDFSVCKIFQGEINHSFGEGGFGVPVADILSAPSTPACAFPGASMRRNFSCKAFALEFFTGTLRFKSPDFLVIKRFINFNLFFRY